MIQIDDLYVSPTFRNAKIGQNLIHQLALIAKSKNIGRLNVWCVKDNKQGQNFYQKIGAEKKDFIDVYSIQVTKLLT
jgi:ribosomal protein S18 acetylase RimI-like enzyme